MSTVKSVNLPAKDKTTPAAESELECHNPQESSESTGACQEAHEVQTPPQRQTSPILLDPVSPELVRNLPMAFPPSPLLQRF